MAKDNKIVPVRLPEELRNYEAYGFKNISEYIKHALLKFNEQENFESEKTSEIIQLISNLIEIMEAKRDSLANYELPLHKHEHMEALYQAAFFLANTTLMKQNPANWMDYPEELKEQFEGDAPEKSYKFDWAL